LGRGIGTFPARRGRRRINLGRDTRPSSPRLREAMAAGRCAAGRKIADIGVAPAPMLYFSVHHRGAEGAVTDRYFGYDDTLCAVGRLMEIVSGSGRPLPAQLEGPPKMVSTPEIRVDCAGELKFEVVRRAAEHLRGRHETVDVDGGRVRFEEGWGLVRASNTQPGLVMRFEARRPALPDHYRQEDEAAGAASRASAQTDT
jgi:phosphomannomutase